MTWKRSKKNVLATLGVLVALLIIPTFALIYIAFGIIDVLRNDRKDFELFDRYFFGNGFFTAWLFSPINLLTDVFCYRNQRIFALKDFSDECRQEIADVLAIFERRKELIIDQIDQELGDDTRGMYVFRWFGKCYNTEFEELNKPFNHLRTIAVSVFEGKESTTAHFGPLRMTLRILYNLRPFDSANAFIQCGNTVHFWRDDPLFIFDDTLIHRSVNEDEGRRYCVFIDVLRPSPMPWLLLAALSPLTALSRHSRALFYRRWKMMGTDTR